MTSPDAANLLVELGCEELPPKSLAVLAEAFFEGVCSGLQEAGVDFSADQSRFFFTPRRMTLLLAAVAARQPDRLLEKRGPAVAAAFDDSGAPTAAASGFARSVGSSVEALERLSTDKGEWLFCRMEQPGKPLSELIFPILQKSLNNLPVPKPMRWSGHDFSFVRPVHWLVALHGEEVLHGSLYGCESGRLTRGHRIHAPGPHELTSADVYLGVLLAARVIADQEQRSKTVFEQASSAGTAAGGETRITPALLAEVCNLVEWPVPVTCSFDEEFLAIPQEALVASMEEHQKFFPVFNPSTGKLTPDFIVIANLDSKDVEQVRKGFERVVRPRLADARFFWEQDLRQPLAANLERLNNIVFQEKLGSVGDKSRRISSVSQKLTDFLENEENTAEKAALMSKCDLVSLMVGEFPELQGTMGGYYAIESGESREVADAVAQHYRPRFSGDQIPDQLPGQIVALSDRLDTLVGIFAVGLKPTGSKDPFALRRSALAVIRILLEGSFPLTLDEMLHLSETALRDDIEVNPVTIGEVKAFILERLRHHLMDQGHTANQVKSVLAAPLNSLPDLWSRLTALSDFMGDPNAESLVSANKRIGNILKKQEGDISETIDTKRFVLEDEGTLFGEVERVKHAIQPHLDSGAYDRVLGELASLRGPVDAYFDRVMVMDEDPGIRGNRLAQLADLKGLFDSIADFSLAA
jgi:glycyl-tRNA synthetase beta chain